MTSRYPKPGTVLLGKYRVENVIGEGGMGGVVRAWHLDLEEPVALKILLPEMADRSEIVSRFTREAKAAVKLKGEHVARVLDVGKLEADADGQFEGTPYIAMEYLEGADLNQIIKAHGPQEPSLAVDLLLQACEAIAEAHSLGIIHRDIKSSNFFITQIDDQPPQLKVLDFGIATPPKGTSDLTDGESVIGTPAYMAPEQMRSARQADARSDIWSMGVVLYEMLEAHKPFRSEAYSDLCLKVGMDPPEAMEQPNTPDALRAVVMKCLEKPIERRYQSVSELAFDLLPFASDPVIARASVEATARLLSRRGTRSFDAKRAPDDVTPAGGPLRLTPPVGKPISQSDPRLTPAQGVPAVDPNNSSQTTPSAMGQLERSASQAPQAKRRGMVVAASFLVMIVLAGGGVMIFTKGSKRAVPATPAAAPTEPVTPTEVMPPANDTKPVPDVVAEPAGSAAVSAGSADPANGSAAGEGSGSSAIETKKTVKKRPHGGTTRPRQDDPFNRR